MKNGTNYASFSNISHLAAVIVFGIFVLAELFDIFYLRIIGCLLYFLFIFCLTITNAAKLLLMLAPNMAIIVLTNNGIGLFGLGYLIIIAKIVLNKKLNISLLMIVSSLLLLCISGSKVLINNNYYDFAIVSGVICSVTSWSIIDNYYNKINEFDCLSYYKSFQFGCILLMLNMLIAVAFDKCLENRWRALNDDPNYTGFTLCIFLMCTLIVYCYRLPIKYNSCYMFFCTFMGLATGSRGFLLSVACGLLVLLLADVFGKREKRIIALIFLTLVTLFSLYSFRVSFIMNVYDATIGRTLNLLSNYETSAYMDFTSGRIFLWNYYMDMIRDNKEIFAIGRGFYNYHLLENGGYGQVAHNAYISSVIGLGIIGTFFLVLLYFSLVRNKYSFNGSKKNKVFISIIISMLINMFFLDAILDFRLVIFLVTFVNLFRFSLAFDKLQFVAE